MKPQCPNACIQCPRCGVNPPRYPPVTLRGRVPICAMCLRQRNQAKYQRRVTRATGWRGAVRADQGYRHDDIAAVEIERRFGAALAQAQKREQADSHE